MQLVQLGSFLIFNSFRPHWSYLVSFLLVLIMMVIVPILSSVHWIWAAWKGIAWAGGYNSVLNAWLFSYSAQGYMNLFYFIMLYPNSMKPMYDAAKD